MRAVVLVVSVGRGLATDEPNAARFIDEHRECNPQEDAKDQRRYERVDDVRIAQYLPGSWRSSGV